jgi:hypothetical protein
MAKDVREKAMPTQIETLFANDIRRPIEEVIKVDQTDADILHDEIAEYVTTDAIRGYFTGILDRYRETPNKPHEGIAVWISGFFGSGKSSFAKMLGLTVGNRSLPGGSASVQFAERAGDKRLQVLLASINEQIPTHTVIFDVSTDRGIKSGNQTLTEIMYRLFLQSLGYAKDLDLSELEICLEEEKRLDAFKATYARLFEKNWDAEKGKVAFALSEASRVMHELDVGTYSQPDSWVRAAKDRNDVSPGRLAERCAELMKRRRPGQSLMFVVDEVGQFVARDVQKMLDLQGVVQSLGRIGRGKHWVVVTSQEKLNDLVGGLDQKQIELARLMDRFPHQVHLEPSDISEVTSRRVLSKNAGAQESLRKLFEEHRSRLTDNTRMRADIKLPDLTAQSFVDLYPLLPYQIDLIIKVVSGLRTQDGASKHVGGANRTIIKLAQQLLINPAVDLAKRPVRTLARLDQVYDLVDGNISSEVRGKIASIPKEVPHPLAESVAKAICLLQYVQSVHRTAENIAAALHPAVDADSQLAPVKEALEALVSAHKIRLGDDGYRIPSPAEDDWEQMRAKITARSGDSLRLQTETLESFWQPQPTHNFLDTKVFKAGLELNGRPVVEGDLTVKVHLAEAGKMFTDLVAELRTRSQQETRSIFWAVAVDDAIEHETRELFRSKEMLSRKEREPKTEMSLVGEEKVRLRRHQEELRRRLKSACLAGTVYFRGNDRSPGDGTIEVGRAVADLLGHALPAVYDRFHEAAARVGKKDIEVLLTTESLHGLTPVFGTLGLLRDEKGRPAFRTDAGPLAEVMARIEQRSSYGDMASGRYLGDELANPPFGWEFDAVRLFVLSLLRAGRIEVTSKGQTFDSALSVEAKDTFTNNNVFRQATFRPKQGIEHESLIKAADAFRTTFGKEIKELEQGKLASAIRDELAHREETVQTAYTKLVSKRLPGAQVLEAALEQIRGLRRGNDSATILGFCASFQPIREAVKRAAELEQALTEPRLRDLAQAQEAVTDAWPFLRDEPDVSEELRTKAVALEDVLARETFFRELPLIDQTTRAIEDEYERRFQEALAARSDAYEKAFARLIATPGWHDIDEDQQRRIGARLENRIGMEYPKLPIPQLRADRDACASRLHGAIAEMMRLIEGERVVTVQISTYFSSGVETEAELEAAIEGLREECARLIGAGKKVLFQ